MLRRKNGKHMSSRCRRDLIGPVAEHLLRGPVRIHDVSLHVGLVDPYGYRVGQFPVPGLACLQGLLGQNALRDISDDPPDTDAVLGKMDGEFHDLEGATPFLLVE